MMSEDNWETLKEIMKDEEIIIDELITEANKAYYEYEVPKTDKEILLHKLIIENPIHSIKDEDERMAMLEKQARLEREIVIEKTGKTPLQLLNEIHGHSN